MLRLWIISIFPCQVEILKPVKKVHYLPYVAAQLLRVFQQERVFCTLFLCMMAKQIRTHYVQVRGCCVLALMLDVSEHITHLAARTNVTGMCSHRTHC